MTYIDQVNEAFPQNTRRVNLAMAELLEAMEKHPNVSGEWLCSTCGMSMQTFYRYLRVLRAAHLVKQKKYAPCHPVGVKAEPSSKDSYFPPDFYALPVSNKGFSAVAKWMASLPEAERDRVFKVMTDALDQKLINVFNHIATLRDMSLKAYSEYAKRPGEVTPKTDEELKALVEQLNDMIR